MPSTASLKTLSRAVLSLLATLFVAIGPNACKKTPRQPSPEYAQARDSWVELFKEKQNKAYLDPQIDEILALLKKVDSNSLDVAAAAALKDDLTKNRSEALEREKSLARELEKVASLANATLASDTISVPVNSNSRANASEMGADAGSQAPKQPVLGMDAAIFERHFSRCFEYKSDGLVGGRTGGKVWGLKDLANCRDLHKEVIGKSLLLMDGKVVAIQPSKELEPRPFKVVDGKLVPLAPLDESDAGR